MLEVFLYIGLPYLALTILLVGTIVRFRTEPYTITSLSSQVLEGRKLALGSIPWHAGIFVVLLGHLAAFLFPSAWRTLTSNRPFLLTVETIGIAAAVLCLVGLTMLLYRRLVTAKLQPVTSRMDLVVLALLLAQVLVGVSVALTQRWGAQWSTGTTTPYVWGLLTLKPEMAFVAELPASMKLHLTLAWVTFALVPFTRLIHGFTLPLQYLFRAPQQVVWTTERRRRLEALAAGGVAPETGRRHFVKGLGGLLAAGVLLSVGVLDKLVRYFKGHKLSKPEEEKLLEKKLARVRATAEERALELERLKKDTIFVAKLGALTNKVGKYFIDYQMRPALAFRGGDGLPILISAKCTHLGCTIASELDNKGRILCPCHISYFDIKTGKPNAGAPAKDPLPKIGWVLMDQKGKVVGSRDPGGTTEFTSGAPPDKAALDTLDVWIAKRFEEESA